MAVATSPAGASSKQSTHGKSPKTASLKVVAFGLNQPKKITIGPDGDLVVALSGDGAAPSTCTDGTQQSCLDNSGAIDLITPGGNVKTILSGLPSVSSGGPGAEATGPSEARFVHGHLQVLFQNTNIDPTTGDETYGSGGSLLGDLVAFSRHHTSRIEAAFGPFEAANNPDNGAGIGVTLGLESAIDSDPYSFVPYHHGWAVADAAGNDLLWVSPHGKISVLAVFPTIPEVVPPGTLGPSQTSPETVQAQAVPDSIAVGRDGALYVGELGGFPFGVGSSSVYRVYPGHAPKLFATGFTSIGDIAFDQHGNLLVLEIDQLGLNDPALGGPGLPTPGALISIGRAGKQTTLATTGLEFPTGLAVGCHDTAYISDYGVLSASGGPGGLSGEIVSLQLPSYNFKDHHRHHGHHGRPRPRPRGHR